MPDQIKTYCTWKGIPLEKYSKEELIEIIKILAEENARTIDQAHKDIENLLFFHKEN